MSRFVVGDIHGSYDKLMKALELCGFSDSDTLYCTGDIGDRGPKVRECIEFLMSLGDRFKSVIGNHDIWAYLKLTGDLRRNERDVWRYNGGQSTINAFSAMDNLEEVKFWYGRFPYVIEEDTFRVVHTPTYDYKLESSSIPFKQVTMSNLCESGILDRTFGYDDELFDRSIVCSSEYFTVNGGTRKPAYTNCLLNDKLTIVGHTPLTSGILYDKTMNLCDIDTGGFCIYKINGYEGRITVLNVDTRDFVDSSGLSSNLEKLQ